MSQARMFYESDCNLDYLSGKKIAIIGYGSQGHAHALNLKDSGCDVIVGLYEGSKSWKKAEAQGLKVYTTAEAVKQADIIMFLINDELQADVYKKDIEPNLEEGNMLMFAHGFNIHFGCIVPPKNVDVTMIAPKAPGHTVRSEYMRGRGTPCLIAVHQDATGKAKDLAKDLNTDVTAVLIGSDVKGLADELAAYGADKVIVVDDPELKDYRTEPYTHALASVINEFKPEIMLVGATAIGRDLGPTVSARVKTGLTADCTQLEIGDFPLNPVPGQEQKHNQLLMTRPAFGGNFPVSAPALPRYYNPAPKAPPGSPGPHTKPKYTACFPPKTQKTHGPLSQSPGVPAR